MGVIMMDVYRDTDPTLYPTEKWTDTPAMVYTPDEVAKLFQVKRTTVIGWCRVPAKAEKLGAFKPGGGWRFRADVLHAYLRRTGVTEETLETVEGTEVVSAQTGDNGGEETA